MSCANRKFKVIFINIKNAFKKKTVPKLGIKVGNLAKEVEWEI